MPLDRFGPARRAVQALCSTCTSAWAKLTVTGLPRSGGATAGSLKVSSEVQDITRNADGTWRIAYKNVKDGTATQTDAKFVFMSAATEARQVDRLAERESGAVLEKPFEIEALASCVRDALARSH